MSTLTELYNLKHERFTITSAYQLQLHLLDMSAHTKQVLRRQTNVNNCVWNGVLLWPSRSSSRVRSYSKRNRLQSDRQLPQGNNASCPGGSQPGTATPTPRTRNRKRSSARGRAAAPSASASPPPENGPRSGENRALPRQARDDPAAGGGDGKSTASSRDESDPADRQRPLPRPVRAGAGGGAAHESPPRPRRRQSAGHRRPPRTGRPRRPGLLSAPAARRPRRRADSPGGCRCWPWPARTGAAPHPFRARRSARPEPMGRPRPPPLTSPQQSPPCWRRAFRALRAVIGGQSRCSPGSPAGASPGSLSGRARERLRTLRDDGPRKVRVLRAERGGAGRAAPSPRPQSRVRATTAAEPWQRRAGLRERRALCAARSSSAS